MANLAGDFKFGIEQFGPAFSRPDTACVSYGLPFQDACLKHAIHTFNSSRIFVIASRALTQNSDALERLQKALGDRLVGVRVGISPHTPWSDCLKTLKAIEEASADTLITLGAGSLTDGAKMIRFALANSANSIAELETLWGGKRTQNPKLRANIRQSTMPLICVPTSLSGAEYQALAGATDPVSRRKRGFEPAEMPDLVVLDPELCLTTPAAVWLSTGVRAIDHCVETLCAPSCDAAAAESTTRGLQRLVSGLLKTASDPHDLTARINCQLGVIDAMSGRATGVPLGASHGISHALGPLGVGHGETSCILLAPVCKFNASKGANLEQQRKVAATLMSLPLVQKALALRPESGDHSDLGHILDVVIDALSMPRTLRDVGIGRDDLDLLAKHSLEDPWCKANPFPLTTVEQVLEILEMIVE
ncbi:Dehydrogenase FUM7 [Pseudocercospora fuligena]|uniref:Dehydrogenase FUM7 n=1 Tax=Pseudocercospora fuligena TaxID=685502 RepID=A0A8H6RME8_9PEZI|nr:Dehydrogenase FUM7 [Pseudocercospora fuligena]